MDPIEQKLQEVLDTISALKVSDNEKLRLYGMVQESFEDVVMPIVISHISKDRLEALTADETKITVERYKDLIAEATKDGVAYEEIEQALNTVLTEIASALKEETV